MRTPLLYALHSGNLYGTERMSLETASGLADEYDPVFLAPPGPALAEASRRGFGAVPFGSPRAFAAALWPLLSRSPRVAFLATGLSHSLAFAAANLVLRRPAAHLHVVHGGTDERLSYGRKRWAARSGALLVAVSGFVRERLLAHGCGAGSIEVVENFLPESQVAACPKREPFRGPGVRRAVVVSRVDPIKKVGLLLDALDADPALASLPVRVLGTGWQLEELRARAAARNPNVTFAGFSDSVAAELAASDLLVHTCPEEPFGLAILEAMAAGIPVLVPDAGGAGLLVEEGATGFRFRAGDASDLARRLALLAGAPAELLRSVVEGARGALATRFSEAARVADYRRLLAARLA